MASCQCLPELTKAISAYLTSATLPLPPDLRDVLEAYRQTPESGNEVTVDRLQEELLRLYEMHVHGQPARHGPFVAILGQLVAVLNSDSRVDQWWEGLLEPVSSHLDQNETLAMASSQMTFTPSTDPTIEISQLKNHVLRLNDNLHFERYLKQQHVAYIVELRKRQAREVMAEAQTQDLLNSNKLLKKGLEEARKGEKQTHKDGERVRSLAKKLEEDLLAKLRNLREEKKEWAAERAELRAELESLREERVTLRQLVVEADVRDVGAHQDIQSEDMMVDQINQLKREVSRLTMSVREYEAKETELEQTKASHEAELVGQDTKVQEAQGQRGQPQGQPQDQSAPRSMIENVLAVRRAEQAEKEKQQKALSQDLAFVIPYIAARSPERSGVGVGVGVVSATEVSISGAETSAVLAGPSGSWTRRPRSFSNPEPSAGMVHNIRPRLEAVEEERSSSSEEGSKMSPEGDRQSGRDGGQTSLWKGKDKDKKDDDNRKSTGLWGLRKFI